MPTMASHMRDPVVPERVDDPPTDMFEATKPVLGPKDRRQMRRLWRNYKAVIAASAARQQPGSQAQRAVHPVPAKFNQLGLEQLSSQSGHQRDGVPAPTTGWL